MPETRLQKHVAMPAIPLALLVLSAFSVAAGTRSSASSRAHEQTTTKPADQQRLVRDSARQAKIKRLTVVNRGESSFYFQRISDLFGVAASRTGRFNDGFEDFVEST